MDDYGYPEPEDMREADLRALRSLPRDEDEDDRDRDYFADPMPIFVNGRRYRGY